MKKPYNKKKYLKFLKFRNFDKRNWNKYWLKISQEKNRN
jgi:hypothetical protein